MQLPAPLVTVPCLRHRAGTFGHGTRSVPEECAIAFVYDGASHAVMMATPADLEDFAVGFSLSEAIVDRASQIESLDIGASELGIELRMTLRERSSAACPKRHRLAGPTGCGLCGVETLAEASRTIGFVRRELRVTPAMIEAALASLDAAQALNREARALHAAAFWQPARGLLALREDVGRHNALDKLAGALARAQLPAGEGMVLLTSRVSVEMVQKTARLGAPLIVAVSAPTALAIRTAERAGITLVAVARGGDFEIHSHPRRVLPVHGNADCLKLVPEPSGSSIQEFYQ